MSETKNKHSWAKLIAALSALGLARVLYVYVAPFDLVHDEAYYWDWARHLDYGYYSKPPVIAWVIGLSTWIGGANPVFVRLPTVVFGTVSLLFLYLLAARLYGSKAGWLAMILCAATPGNVALNLIMTIDAPLMCAWSIALYSTWRMLERSRLHLGWAAASACAVGFGLLTKQTMLAFFPLCGLFLLTDRAERAKLLRPGIWVWGGVGLLFLTPVLVWNYQHDWITLQHTSSHFSASTTPWIRRLVRSLEFVGSQFAVLTPVTCFWFFAVGCSALVSFRRLDRRARFLACFSFVPLVGVLVLSLRQRVEPNWPAPFYPAGIVLVSACAMASLRSAVPLMIRPRSTGTAVGVGVAFALATYALPLLLSAGGLVGSKVDPLVRLRGWKELAFQIDQRSDWPPDSVLITTNGRAFASELAFYMKHQPAAFVFERDDFIDSQYDVWHGPSTDSDAVVITAIDETVPDELRAQFDSVSHIADVRVPIGNGRQHAVRVFRGTRLHDWPCFSFADQAAGSDSTLRR